MSVLTITSDYGTKEHYAAAMLIAAQKPPFPKVFELTHGIELGETAQATCTIDAVFRDCPPASVHIVAVAEDEGAPLIVCFESHYFLCADNGFAGLLSRGETEKLRVFRLKNTAKTSFNGKNIFMPAALKLLAGALPEDLGHETENFKISLFMKPKTEERRITANVIKKEETGNLISNLDKKTFWETVADNDFEICFAREKVRLISPDYASVEPGDCGVLFNDGGLLEIFINRGSASELLGMGFNSRIRVEILGH
jgi:S-adenosylmethionine hydrolase